MEGSLWHFTRGSDQDHPKEKEMQEGKVIVQGGFTNSQGKKRREKEGYTQLNAECYKYRGEIQKPF